MVGASRNDAVTFREILTFRGIPWRPSHNPQELTMPCPFCGDERLILSVNDVKGMALCHTTRCNWRSQNGTLKKILRAFSIMDVSLAQTKEEKAREEEKLKLPEGFYPIRGVTPDDELGMMAIEYMEKRGITRKTMEQWRFGVTFSGRHAYRVVMPIYYKRELRMYVSRDITGTQEPKYLNNKGAKYFWGIPHVSRCTQPVFLCEGIIKALALREHGVKAAAMMGMTVTDTMMEQLFEMGHGSVTVWPDPGTQGVIGALKLCDNLSKAGIACTLPMPLPNWQADEKIEPYTLTAYSPFLKNQIRIQHCV